MNTREYDVVIIGSGAGGGTVAQALAPMVAQGKRILVVEQGGRLDDVELTGREREMADALYEQGGGALTADGTMTLAYGRTYGGSTAVYTGVTLVAPARVIREWCVPGLDFADIERRSRKYMAENSVHYLPRVLHNDNNRLFFSGCHRAGHKPEQFPLNLRGCKGASLCNLGCPNAAKMGTNRVQLPNAERAGVEVVTRAEALRLEERAVVVRVHGRRAGEKGRDPEWAPGDYRISSGTVVVAAGAIGTSALLLRSPVTQRVRGIGERFTCHPAMILVAEHEREITNDVGHPKSYYLDHAEHGGYLLETCMYFPFVTAKGLTGFGSPHSSLMRAFPRLQMILALACDKAVPENRVTIDPQGRAVVQYTLTDAVLDALYAATKTSARIFFAAGARRVHAPGAVPPLIEREDAYRIDDLVRRERFLPGTLSLSAAHMMGGCAMGGEGKGVTDSRGRIHGHPWLRIADSSLFPDSVEVNPYLTVMALADRVAEAILQGN